MPPRLIGTPTQAFAPEARLVPAVCPTFESDAQWRAHRLALVREGRLHADEAALADLLPAARRGTFVGGRLAMREALRQCLTDAVPLPAIVRSARGAPLVPPGLVGSISHKHRMALAVVAPRTGAMRHVGVDLERRPTAHDLARPSIARRILTAVEHAALEAATTDALERRERTLVYFAIKEAVYKAIDPFVGRYVRFTEVELVIGRDHADVTLLLPELSSQDVEVRAQWHCDGPWIVTSAFSYR
jgi:4'-phosphopantetheinyl transferase EntD